MPLSPRRRDAGWDAVGAIEGRMVLGRARRVEPVRAPNLLLGILQQFTMHLLPFDGPRLRLLTSLTLVATLASCNSDDNGGTIAPPPPPPPAQSTLGDFISGLQLNGTTGTVELKSGAAPAGSAAGAVLQYAGGGTVAQGSTAQGNLTGVDPFDALIVRFDGVDDFYEVALAQQETAVDLFLSLGTEAPAGMVDCQFQGRRAGETEFGEPITIPLEILDVGSGELQVNLTWNTDADLDIHVFEPSGNEIFWNNTTSPTGGQLDLDANVGCGSVSVENIFWSLVPPVGTYRVAIENYTECSQVSSSFIVTVTVPGQAPIIATGSITEADGLLEVTTFDI